MKHHSLNESEFELVKHKYNILLITITPIEFKVAYRSLKPIKIDHDQTGFLEYIDSHNQTFYLGVLGEYPVALTKVADTGTAGQHTIGNMIHESISNWPAKYVFLLGVCATTDVNKAPIGSVIISKEVIAYEKVKYTFSGNIFMKNYTVNHIIDRSPRFYPGISMKNLDIFMSINKNDFEVMKGTVLSGEKVISNKRKLNELKTLFPNALAVEMEGVGLASALNSIGINDWVVIKGVSDDAIKKQGHDNQDTSMTNVMHFMEAFFNQKGLFSPGVKMLSKEDVIKNCVLVSGSFDPEWQGQLEAEEFAYDLSQALVKSGYKIITGYGHTVGPAVVAGAYQKACDMKKHLSDALDTFPFPRIKSPRLSKYVDAIKAENRLSMVLEAGIAIFIFGHKTQEIDGESKEIYADGVWDEFIKASKRGLLCIPIPATGYVAKDIWLHIKQNFAEFYPDANDNFVSKFNQLEDESLDNKKMIELVIQLIKDYQPKGDYDI